MSAKHRKASKLAAKRTAIAATAIGATASIGLMGAPAQAATATPPDYSKAISDYSHALDNFLNASNNVNGSAGSVWNPIANGSGGLLPTFGSTFNKVDATAIASLPTILKNLGGLTLPTSVPGVVPDIILPGGQKITLPLPTSLPGGSVLIEAGDALQSLLDTPVLGDIIKGLPAGSELIKGLEITQSKYTNFYDFKFLGINGETVFTNTFAKTPDGLTLTLPPGLNIGDITLPLPILGGTDIPLVPSGTLPSGTIWMPQGNGTYNFPLGGQLGWWGAMPTAALKLPAAPGGSETVLSVPIYAAGAQLPLNIAKFGVMGGSVLLPTQNGVYSPIGATVTNLSTFLPFGVTNLNVTTGNYVGTNGFNVNNGQNLMLIQNPLLPLPLIYGLGGVNFGVDGAGISSPSLFGIKLFSDLQVGTPAGPNSPAGLIPPSLLPTDPMNGIISTITGGLGVGSLTQITGLDTIIKPVMTAFGPVYATFVTPVLKPISDFATQQYGPFVNNSASQLLDLSKTLSQQTANLPGAPDTVPATDSGAQSQKALLASSDTPAGPNLLARTQQQPVTDTTDATPDVGGNGDQSPAPAGATGGNGGTADAGEGKHRTGTPVKEIAERITGGLDSLGDKITAGADKNSDKVTGGTDKSTEAAAVPETKTDVSAPAKDEAPTTTTEEKTEAPAASDAA